MTVDRFVYCYVSNCQFQWIIVVLAMVFLTSRGMSLMLLMCDCVLCPSICSTYIVILF